MRSLIAFILLASCAIYQPAFAQFQYGLQIGGGVSNIKDKSPAAYRIDYNSGKILNIGLETRAYFSGSAFLESGPIIEIRSARFNQEVDTSVFSLFRSSGDLELTTTFIALPLIYNRTWTKKSYTVGARFGPSFDFNIYGEIADRKNSNSIGGDEIEIKPLDVSFRFGGRVETTKGVGLKIDYILGTSNIYEGGLDGNRKWKSRALQLSVYWMFGGEQLI